MKLFSFFRMSEPLIQSNLSRETFDFLSKKKELRRKLSAFYALELDEVNGAVLLDQLNKIFIDITCMQFEHNQSESPWVTFLAKEESFCNILNQLVSEERLSHKFSRTLHYVGRILSNDIIQAMDNAGFPLKEEILSYLKFISQKEIETNQYPSRIDLKPSAPALETAENSQQIENKFSSRSAEEKEVKDCIQSFKVILTNEFEI